MEAAQRQSTLVHQSSLSYIICVESPDSEDDYRISPDYWVKHTPDGILFRKEPNLKQIISYKPNNKKLVEVIPLHGMKPTIAFGAPRDPDYGCLSNYYAWTQTIKELAEDFFEFGFDGTIPCAEVGLMLCKIAVIRSKNIVSKEILNEKLQLIFKGNKDLLQIAREHGADMTLWEKKGAAKKQNPETSPIKSWNTILNGFKQIDYDLPLNLTDSLVFYNKFRDEVLYNKFNAAKLQGILRNCHGFIINAAVSNSEYGFMKSTFDIAKELKLAESDGRVPNFSGTNVLGLLLEDVRDRYNGIKLDEPKKQVTGLTSPKPKVDTFESVEKAPIGKSNNKWVEKSVEASIANSKGTWVEKPVQAPKANPKGTWVEKPVQAPKANPKGTWVEKPVKKANENWVDWNDLS